MPRQINKAWPITRTIWVSCFPLCGTSCHSFCFPACRQAGAPAPKTNPAETCTRTPAFAEATAGNAHICKQFKSCTLIRRLADWLRDSLYSRVLGVPGPCPVLSVGLRLLNPTASPLAFMRSTITVDNLLIT